MVMLRYLLHLMHGAKRLADYEPLEVSNAFLSSYLPYFAVPARLLILHALNFTGGIACLPAFAFPLADS